MAVIFPFVFRKPGFREHQEFSTGVDDAGRRTVQKLKAAGELVVRGNVLFPNAGGTWASFVAFHVARFGAWGSFLYKAQDKGAAATTDAHVAIAGQQDFDAVRRFVDVATLVVKKAGVVQTIVTHYTVQNESGGAYVLGTSTKLVVRFVAAPGAAVAVALEYEFYYPVRFEMDDLDEQDLEAGGAGGAAVADRTLAVRLRETGPGYSYAVIPDAL